MRKTLDARKAGTTCTRCGQDRWPFKDWVEPYVCQRCTEVLAGGNALDPLRTRTATPGQVAGLARARASRSLQGQRGRPPVNPEGAGQGDA